MLIATYDYWGYYNITFLGGEVKDPARTVPRAILISIGLVAAIYLAMNISVIAVLPWQRLVGPGTTANLNARRAVISLFHGDCVRARALGPMLGKVAAVLVMVDGVCEHLLAAAGVFADSVCGGAGWELLFECIGRLHKAGFPHVSLLALGGMGIVFCFFSLADVIAALVVLRILVQFLMQHIGVIYLRKSQPEMKRPFRIWLYPLPPVVAICGFVYILIERANFLRELLGAAVVILLGTAVYAVREKIRALPSVG